MFCGAVQSILVVGASRAALSSSEQLTGLGVGGGGAYSLYHSPPPADRPTQEGALRLGKGPNC